MRLSRRSINRRFYPGVWDFPGGHCKENESFKGTLLRKAAEELGILPVAYCEVATIRRDGQLEAVLFAVTSWAGAVQNRVPEEHECLDWFTWTAARALPRPDPEHDRLFDVLEAACLSMPHEQTACAQIG